MWTTEYCRVTAADPARVWAVLADVDGWGAWNDGIDHIELDAPLGVGATFRMTPPGEEPLVSTIAELDPGRRLTDVTELDGVVVRVAHDLEPTDDGRTRVTYRVEVAGPSDPEVAEQIGRAVSAHFPDVLAGLAAAAEAA
ncbi:SRPBCC family protein [Jatrophihabitans sp. YIM 134969]